MNRIPFPALVVEGPPLGWVHGEPVLLHGAAQQVPVRALRGGAARDDAHDRVVSECAVFQDQYGYKKMCDRRPFQTS